LIRGKTTYPAVRSFFVLADYHAKALNNSKVIVVNPKIPIKA